MVMLLLVSLFMPSIYHTHRGGVKASGHGAVPPTREDQERGDGEQGADCHTQNAQSVVVVHEFNPS